MKTIREQAKEAERLNNWQKAYDLYKSLNMVDDMNACKMIIDSTKRGDEYRAAIAGKNPDEQHAIYIDMFLPHLKP